MAVKYSSSKPLILVIFLLMASTNHVNAAEEVMGDLTPPPKLKNLQHWNFGDEVMTRHRIGELSKAIEENHRNSGQTLFQLESLRKALLYDSHLQNELLSVLSEHASSSNSTSNSTCTQDLNKVVMDLIQAKGYAVQVVDAMGKLPSGVTKGNVAWLGDYDLCTGIKEYTDNTSQTVSFQGQYCAIQLRGPVLGKLSPAFALLGFTEGICVPQTCNSTELTALMDIVLIKAFKRLNASTADIVNTLKQSHVFCAAPAEWKQGDTAAVVLASILLLLGLCGSTYDIIQRILTSRQLKKPEKTLFPATSSEWNGPVNSNDNVDLLDNEVGAHGMAEKRTPNAAAVKAFFHQFLMSFSAITNGQKLLGAGMREGQLGAINGIRVLSMWWVILGHTNAFVITTGGVVLVDNILDLQSYLQRFTFQTILNATFSVDSFFYLSGLLMAYLLLRELKKADGKLPATNWALLYFHRFWRLTPVYMFVLMIYSTLYLHMPNGPLMRLMDLGAKQCEKYWWANLLYINNFVPRELGKECMGWSWYLANDMQFFVISPVIIYLLYRFRYVGYAVIMAVLLGCLISTGVVARINHASPLVIGGQGNGKTFGDLYVQPWYRISPYLVGICTGYFIHLWENNGRPRTYKICVVVGWCLAIAINVSVLYGLYEPTKSGKPWNDDVNALYIATSRFAWSLGLAWVTYACITGNGGPVNKILSWGVWAPLGRLTYCAYLVHPMVIYNLMLSKKSALHYNDYNMIYLYVAHLVISYLVAFVVSVAVEAPMMGLEKLIFKKKKD